MQDGIIECEKIVGFKNGKQKNESKETRIFTNSFNFNDQHVAGVVFDWIGLFTAFCSSGYEHLCKGKY